MARASKPGGYSPLLRRVYGARSRGPAPCVCSHGGKRFPCRAGLAAKAAGGANAMTPLRWQQIHELFDAALLHQSATRPSFLEAACDGDPLLCAEVQELLSCDERASSEQFLDCPLWRGDGSTGPDAKQAAT